MGFNSGYASQRVKVIESYLANDGTVNSTTWNTGVSSHVLKSINSAGGWTLVFSGSAGVVGSLSPSNSTGIYLIEFRVGNTDYGALLLGVFLGARLYVPQVSMIGPEQAQTVKFIFDPAGSGQITAQRFNTVDGAFIGNVLMTKIYRRTS